MGNIKWVVVLREYCLGGPLGFVLFFVFFNSSLLWGCVAEELNPASWPPLCFSCFFFPWFLCSTVALHLLLQCYLLFSRCSLCVTFASLVFSSAPSVRCVYWVPCWSRPKISHVACSCFLTSTHTKFSSPLVLLCSCSHFDISALLCYYAHSNVCKYIVGLNTNVSLLLFCMCLLSQVLVFDPVRVGRV